MGRTKSSIYDQEPKKEDWEAQRCWGNSTPGHCGVPLIPLERRRLRHSKTPVAWVVIKPRVYPPVRALASGQATGHVARKEEFTSYVPSVAGHGHKPPNPCCLLRLIHRLGGEIDIAHHSVRGMAFLITFLKKPGSICRSPQLVNKGTKATVVQSHDRRRSKIFGGPRDEISHAVDVVLLTTPF